MRTQWSRAMRQPSPKSEEQLQKEQEDQKKRHKELLHNLERHVETLRSSDLDLCRYINFRKNDPESSFECSVQIEEVLNCRYETLDCLFEDLHYLWDSEFPIVMSLHLAVLSHCNICMINDMLDDGVNVNTKNDLGQTVLHRSTKREDLEIVTFLVSQGADVHAKDNDGRTPLHEWAWFSANDDVCRYLVSQGADVYAQDNEGQTPIDYAHLEERKRFLRDCEAARF